jgi:hypothetical protein
MKTLKFNLNVVDDAREQPFGEPWNLLGDLAFDQVVNCSAGFLCKASGRSSGEEDRRTEAVLWAASITAVLSSIFVAVLMRALC